MNLAVGLTAVALVVYIGWLEGRIKDLKQKQLTQNNLMWDGIKAACEGGKMTLKALDMTDTRVSILEGKLKAIPENAIPGEVLAQMISQFHKADVLQKNQ